MSVTEQADKKYLHLYMDKTGRKNKKVVENSGKVWYDKS